MLRIFINLQRSKDRRENLQNRLAQLNLDFKRCDAVDAKKLSSDFCAKIQYSKNDFFVRSRYTRQLTAPEIACFLSHRECWKQLVDSNEEYATILEDALVISDRASKYLNNEQWIPKNLGICRLSCYEPMTNHIISKNQIKLDAQSRLIIQLKPKPLGTQGYIISKEAAQLALALSKKIPCPVDDFLFTPFFEMSQHFPAWQLDPCIITRDFSKKSDIGSRAKHNIKELKANFFVRHSLTRMLLKHRLKKKIKTEGTKAYLSFQ